jgi:hypothetical protein
MKVSQEPMPFLIDWIADSRDGVFSFNNQLGEGEVFASAPAMSLSLFRRTDRME